MAKFRDNGFALALAAGLALALIFGLVYAITAGSRRVAGDAEALHAADQTIQSATVALAQLELAAYQMSLASAGVVVDPAAIARAVDRSEAAIADARTAHSVLADSDKTSPQLSAALSQFVGAADSAAGNLRSNRPADIVGVDATYSSLMEELAGARDQLLVAVGAGERSNAWSSAIAGFLAVFTIPAAVISTFYVLDRRRRRQHELEVALEAERAALASREQFLTTVSHELRKPLTGVRGIAQMLSRDEALMQQPRMADLHSLLVGELDDMTGLVDDLLTASRLEAGGLEYSIEPIDVRAEARSLIDTLNPRGASIYVAMDEGVVNADRRRLRQMLRNLLTNAIKYGGPNIEVKGLSDGDSYTVAVVDDGQGVPTAVEEHLFTRFVHGDDTGAQSVGLGLSIVMALAVGMGGTAFHKREDGLTRFGVRLPTAVAPGELVARYEPPTMAPISRAIN